MNVYFHRNFKKQFKCIPKKIQKQFWERMDLFVTDQHHPLLQVHTLHGDRHPYVSFNVNADYRVILLYEGDGVTLYEIGTHSELYG